MPVVVTNIKRAERAATDALAKYGVATIHEAQGRTGLMAPHLRPIYKGAQISGTALTATVAPGDNWTIHVAAEQCLEGDIVVVSPTAAANSGYFGDLLGTLLKSRGARGMIIEAGCRDINDLEQMGFPVWSKCVHAHGTVKETVGDVNIAISCGGQIVNPGDAIVADDDGIVVVPRLNVAEVLASAEARMKKEELIRERYGSGELGLDMNNMRPSLEAKGLVYISQDEFEKKQ